MQADKTKPENTLRRKGRTGLRTDRFCRPIVEALNDNTAEIHD